MSKEYQDYTKKFHEVFSADGATKEEITMAGFITYWSKRPYMIKWTPDQIKEANECSPGAKEWQEFCEGLKSVNTKVKLLRLERMYTSILDSPDMPTEFWLVKCRVESYIEALVITGLLAPISYEVLK